MIFSARSFSKKLFTFFLVFLFALGLISPLSASAQNYHYQTNQNPYTNFNTNPDVPLNQRTAIDAILINLAASSVCTLSGVDVMEFAPQEYTNQKTGCLGLDPITGRLGFVDNGQGLVGLSGNMIAMLYTPPASTQQFTSYLASNFGVTERAYAQATGFEGLSKLVEVWAIFRNIAYLLMVIAFIIVGFVIMLRVKIDPRTVMSIQNMLPRLVAAIIFITFSYSIAGLLIDVMWASTYLSINVVSDAIEETDTAGVYNRGDVINKVQDYPFKFFNEVFWNDFGGVVGITGTLEFSRQVADSVGIIFRSLTDSGDGQDFLTDVPGAAARGAALSTVGGAVGLYFGDGLRDALSGQGQAEPAEEEDDGCGLNPFCHGTNFVKEVIGGTVGAVTGVLGDIMEGVFSALMAIISWLLAILVFVVVLVAIIVTLFRIWFILLRAYIVILLGVVWAPFWILFGVLPGSTINFTQWLRHMVAHLAVFPAAVILFLMARVFINVFEPTGFFNTGTGGSIFLPPLIGNAALPEALGPLIAFGVLMYIPSTLNILRDALKTPASKYNNSINAGIGAGVGVLSRAGNESYQRYSHRNEGVLEAGGGYKRKGIINFFGRPIG